MPIFLSQVLGWKTTWDAFRGYILVMIIYTYITGLLKQYQRSKKEKKKKEFMLKVRNSHNGSKTSAFEEREKERTKERKNETKK